MSKLQAWYAGLQQRERRMVLGGGIALGVMVLLFGILLPLQGAVSKVSHRIEVKREDLKWMQVNAPEVQSAANVVAADTGEAPMVLVDRVGREAGLGGALRGTQPESNGVRVQLEGAAFDTLITWLATLDQRYGLSIDSITVDRSPQPGLVNANISLTQPKH